MSCFNSGLSRFNITLSQLYNLSSFISHPYFEKKLTFKAVWVALMFEKCFINKVEYLNSLKPFQMNAIVALNEFKIFCNNPKHAEQLS